jgi:RAT1-interacting protein
LEKTIKSIATTGLEKPNEADSQVWRVKFKPKYGIEIKLLDDDGVREVINGEDRVGFLPKWYWEDVSRLPSGIQESTHANASASKHPLNIEGQKPDDAVKTSGWVI